MGKAKVTDNKDNKKKKTKKFRKLIIILLCLFLLVNFIAVLIRMILNILLKDANRSTFIDAQNTYTEIVKKNYINGFKETKNNGDFSFVLPEEDINQLLFNGTKSINDKYIESVYYSNENNHECFYVDLSKTVVKTRVVLDLVLINQTQDEKVLQIASCKIGKINALNYLKRKKYLTNNFVNDYFSNCNLPITYNQDKYTFTIRPFNFIGDFPETTIGNAFLNIAHKNNLLVTNENLFGFNISFSYFGKNSNLSYPAKTSVPNFYNEIKTGCKNVDFDHMTIGDKVVAYSITENDFNNLLYNAMSDSNLQKVTSLLTTNIVTFDLNYIETKFDVENKINTDLYFSLNNYLVKVHTTIELTDYSSTSGFLCQLNINYDATFPEIGFEPSSLSSIDFSFVYKAIGSIFKDLQDYQPALFTYVENQDSVKIDLIGMNNSFTDATLRDSGKSLKINPDEKSLQFIIEKTTI